MKKIIIAASALAFIVGAGLVQAGDAKNKEAVAAACKDKKPGDKVKVDGKEVKCPKPKK